MGMLREDKIDEAFAGALGSEDEMILIRLLSKTGSKKCSSLHGDRFSL